MLAPDSQNRGAYDGGSTRGPLTPVTGAKVTLTDIDSGQEVGSTTTDSSGKYGLNDVKPGKNYRIQATKPVTGGQLLLCAIASTSATDANIPKQRDLDPDSTVATIAAEDAEKTLAAADPGSASADLETVARVFEKKRKATNAPSPDLTKPEDVKRVSDDLKKASSPTGSFYGDYTGDTSGKIAALIQSDKFFLISLPKAGSAQTGTNTGGGSDKSGNNAVTGSVKDGVISANGKDVNITGIFSGDVASGTWKSKDGKQHGTWKLSRLTDALAGIYRGRHKITTPAPNAGGGTGSNSDGKGEFTTLVLDDHTVFVFGGQGTADSVHPFGTGTVNSSGKLQFTLPDSKGNVTGDGQITGDTLSGTYKSTSGEEGVFTGSRLTTIPSAQ